MRGHLSRARKRLELTSTQIDELLGTKYRDAKVPTGTNSFCYHWLEADLDLADKAEELIKQLEYTIKRSYVLAKTRESNPTGLGARTKERPEPGKESKVYPTLEEEAAPAPDRTQDWVHESKFEDSRKKDLQQDYIKQKVSKSVMHDEASGQPPDYVQTMRMQ